jgi:hypothetical protein
MGGYGFGLGDIDYFYATYDARVNFGGGLVTSPTPVNVELFSFPTSLQALQHSGLTFQSFEANDGAAGTLGIGPNATGPGHSIPLKALPAPFNQGVLINENQGVNGYLQFGPNPLTPVATLNGSPITDLKVIVGSTTYTNVPSIIDSGGVDGSFPTSLGAKPGELITVETPSGQVLYSFTYQGTYSPTPISSGLMDTGNEPFFVNPIYISYSPSGVGTTVIDA